MLCFRCFTALTLSVMALLTGVYARAGQSSNTAVVHYPAAADSIPRFIQFSGKLEEYDGRPAAGVVGITFLLFAEEEGGQSLWRETQNVSIDAEGRYTVALGRSTPYGLPAELFADGQSRWLAIEPEGLPTPARVMLLSVPYALKAGDAETLGGLPASAFLRSVATPQAGFTDALHGSQSAAQSSAQSLSSAPAGSGLTNYIPRWTPNGSTLGNSALFQSGSGSTAKVGVNTSAPGAMLDVNGSVTARGTLQLPAKAAATSVNGAASQPLIFQAAAFSSSTGTAATPKFQWQAEAAGNNTTAPGATMNLLYSATGAPVETGLAIAGNGKITFAAGQTFPGTGTLTGITAGTGMTGGGTSGKPTLSVDATKVPLLGSPNTFTAPITMTAPITFAGGQTFPGAGTLTGITAGIGLTGGGATGNPTIAVDTTRVPLLNSANTFTAPMAFAAGQTFPGTVTSVTAGTGLSGGGSGGALTLNLNTGFSDGRYAQLGANNTFAGTQVVNASLGIGVYPSYPLHVNGLMRSESGLSLGGNGVVSVDAPGIIGGHFLVNGAGKVGINNNLPQSALDVSGSINASGSITGSSLNASSVKIGSDSAMTSAPRFYLTSYVQGPLNQPGPVHAIYTIPSKNILVTRITAGMVNVCWQTDTMVLYLYANSTQVATLTVSGGAIPSDSGELSVPIAAGSRVSLEIKIPNCGFGATVFPEDIPISIEYVMQ